MSNRHNFSTQGHKNERFKCVKMCDNSTLVFMRVSAFFIGSTIRKTFVFQIVKNNNRQFDVLTDNLKRHGNAWEPVKDRQDVARSRRQAAAG